MKNMVAAGLLVFGTTGLAQAADFGDGLYDPTPSARQNVPLVSGNVQVHFGLGDYSDCGDCDFWIFGGGGSALVRINDMWGVQLDAGFDNYEFDGGGDTSWPQGGITGHLTYDHIGHFRLGAYLGAQTDDFTAGVTAGVEGQVHLNNWIVEGRAGIAEHDGYGFWHLYGSAEYFFTPNTRMNINLTYADYDWGGSGTFIGAYAEHKFAGRPYSVFAAIDHGNYDANGCCDYDTTTGKVGFKVIFNQDDLIGEEENGSAFGYNLRLPLRLDN